MTGFHSCFLFKWLCVHVTQLFGITLIAERNLISYSYYSESSVLVMELHLHESPSDVDDQEDASSSSLTLSVLPIGNLEHELSSSSNFNRLQKEAVKLK